MAELFEEMLCELVSFKHLYDVTSQGLHSYSRYMGAIVATFKINVFITVHEGTINESLHLFQCK